MTEQQQSKDNFIFKDFEPNRFLKAYCKQVYCLVEERAPSDATKIALLYRVRTGFEGSVRIVSESCTFFITSIHSEPRLVVDDLYTQFTQKIFHWIQNRELDYQNNLMNV